ncbi:MAG: family 78 glycoside hydrolase catalytic domain [Microbacterium sp.]
MHDRHSTALDDAAFITAEAERAAVIGLSGTLVLDGPASEIVSATITATAQGVYELSVDGASVTDSVLNPGWTAYEWRLQYQQFDVTGLLTRAGRQVRIDARLGNGWYRGDLGFLRAHANYGEQISFAAALRIRYADGSEQRFVTDDSWCGSGTDTESASLYDGQRIDARLRGRHRPLPVREVPVDRDTLVPQAGPLITRHESLPPQRVWTSPSGRTLVDFGQNLVGWLRIRARGREGTEIVLRHAEEMEGGELATAPLREARATDVFVLSGGDDVFEPTFTFHGFRYAEVTGWPGELAPGDMEAVVVHSDIRRTSGFSCSAPLVNRLVGNAVWSQRSNFLDVATDCPQRDERLGWTGDIAVFAAAASFQFDSADFLHKWLLDLRVETEHAPELAVPYIVPDPLKHTDLEVFPRTPTAVWGDAAVWVPEALWWAYGDLERLGSHYPGMVLHLESAERALSPSGLWDTGFQFGDWLDPDAPPGRADAAKADSGVVATASLYRSASFAATAAGLLGRLDDAERWEALAARLRRAFNEHYVEAGLVRSDCVTVYALAIHFGLLDEHDRASAGERLAELVRLSGYRVTTGFAGTPYATWALSETGHVEEAYRLLLEEGRPSWLYPVTMGATTIWERWDSMLPDGSVNTDGMTSFNHYALGAVVDWIYRVVGGIRPAEPGYRRILIAPVPGPGIEHADTAYDSPVGRIETSWRIRDEVFSLDVVAPDGIPVDVILPDGSRHELHGGRRHFSAAVPAAL